MPKKEEGRRDLEELDGRGCEQRTRTSESGPYQRGKTHGSWDPFLRGRPGGLHIPINLEPPNTRGTSGAEQDSVYSQPCLGTQCPAISR